MVMAREPVRVLASFNEVVTPTRDEAGYDDLLRVAAACSEAGAPLLAVDANELAADAEATLRRMCAFAGIGWDEGMLSWPTGGRPEDGVWADDWYGSVHASSGLERKAGHKPPRAALPTALEPLAGELLPLYKELQRMAAPDEDRYDGRIC